MLKKTENWVWGRLGGMFVASCAQVATGHSGYQHFGDLLGEKGGPKGRYWDPPKTENCLNSDLLTCPLVTFINNIFVATLKVKNKTGFDFETEIYFSRH